MLLGKDNLPFVVWAVGRVILGRSVGKIIIIMLSFRVGTCTNKIIDNEVKEMYYYVNTSDI